MQPITYYPSATTDSQIFDSLSLAYGSQLQTLSRRQKLSLLAMAIAMVGGETFTDVLPEPLIAQVAGLSEDSWLSIMEATVAQLRHGSKN